MSEEGAPAEGGGEPAPDALADVAGDLAAALEGEGGEIPTSGPMSIDKLPEEMAGQMVTFAVNGEDVTMTLGEALKGSQRMKAATQKEMAAAAHRRETDEMVDLMINDPAKLFERGGAKAVERNLIAWIDSDNPELKEAATNAMKAIERRYAMTPEQRKLEDDRKGLDDERKKYKALEEQEQDRQRNAATAQHRDRFEAEFGTALESKGMQSSPYTIQRMAITMGAALAEGVELTAGQAADIVHQERGSEISHHLGALSEDALLSFLGDDVVRKISKAAIARVRRAPARAAGTAPAVKPKAAPRRMMTTEDLRRKWEDERRG